jgi:hypothetical protein
LGNVHFGRFLSQTHLVALPVGTIHWKQSAGRHSPQKFTLNVGDQGCQIFRGSIYQNGENIPNDHKTYQNVIKCNKWPENGPNSHNIYQQRPLQDPVKFTQIGIFGLKTYHLATLLATRTIEMQYFLLRGNYFCSI